MWSLRLPKHVSYLAGALVEPLSVALHATRRAQLTSLSKPSVLIFGAGAIGILCGAVCRASGAARVRIADVQGDRVQFAINHNYVTDGMVIPMRKPTNLEENLAVAKETGARACDYQAETFAGFDAVFECTGVEACTQAAIYVCTPLASPPPQPLL